MSALVAGTVLGEDVEFASGSLLEYPSGVEIFDAEQNDGFNANRLVTQLDSSPPYWIGNDLAPTNYQQGAAQGAARTGAAARQQAGQNTVRAAAGSAAVVGLASIPYMIGDTGAGTCLAFDGLLDVGLAHPTIACSRLNVSENNTPLPTDRLYYSFRHFHNSTPLSVYQFRRTLDVEHHTIGWERVVCPNGRSSIEVRVPVEYRLTSEFLSIVAPAFNVVDLVAADEDRRRELANISAIFKTLLIDEERFVLSGGMGITLPTAQDVNTGVAVSGEVVFPDLPNITMDTNSAFITQFANETVYLSPFLAWRYAPQSRWFHQGFLQVEFAANPSSFYIEGLAANDFYDNGMLVGFYDYDVLNGFRGDLHVQTLMRLNLGFGYRICDRYHGNRLCRMTGLMELHYTTTLEDARLTEVPLTVNASAGTTPLQEITVGNQENRVDILNLASGFSVQFGYWTFTNAAIVPLRDGSNRGFDFELNSQAQRQF